MRSPTSRRSWLLVALGTALAAAGTGTAATPKTVEGTVGPGFTIGLTMSGKKVTKLKAGTAYRFIITDRSSIHDFHLSGPGINRVLTSVEFTDTRRCSERAQAATAGALRPASTPPSIGIVVPVIQFELSPA